MSIKRFILKIRLFFSTLFIRYSLKDKKGFIYENDDDYINDRK